MSEHECMACRAGHCTIHQNRQNHLWKHSDGAGTSLIMVGGADELAVRVGTARGFSAGLVLTESGEVSLLAYLERRAARRAVDQAKALYAGRHDQAAEAPQ